MNSLKFTKKLDELFFTLFLTENEHWIVEDIIKTQAPKFNCQVRYYRKLKQVHVPCYRECKIVGEKSDIFKLSKVLEEEHYIYVNENHYRTTLAYLIS